MRFTFKFERLLRIRRYKLEQLENQLAYLQNELHRETENLKQLYRTLEDYYKTLTACLTGNIDIRQVTALKNYVEKINADIEVQKKVIIQLNNEIATKKKQVISAMQKVKALEKLREKQFAAFLKEMEDKENLILDEIGTTQFIKRQAELK